MQLTKYACPGEGHWLRGKQWGRPRRATLSVRFHADVPVMYQGDWRAELVRLVGDAGHIVSFEHYGQSADSKTVFRECAERSLGN
jgi:hypothetical protein